MRRRLHVVSIREGNQNVEVQNTSEDRQSDRSYSPRERRSTQNPRPPKKVRGPTKKQAIWDLEDDERVPVTFDGTGQPIGDGGNDLTTFLGTLVKMPQHVGIDVKNWKKVSKESKEDLWNIVKGKFLFSPAESEDIKKWVITDMGLKWKSWKYELKKSSFDQNLTIDDIVDNLSDSRVDKVQFRALVTRWFSKETQVESEKNKRIRSKSDEPHVTGTKSFARLIHEERTKNDGVRPSRGTIYRISRTRKDGSIVNAKAADVVDKLKSASDTSNGTSGTSIEEGIMDWTNDDFAKVKGPEKGGRIRCLGKIVKVKGNGSCSSQDPQVPLLKARINELEGEMKDMRDKQDAMVRFMAVVKEQLPNINLSNIFNGNTQFQAAANDSCSAYVNPTSSRASQSHNFDSRRGKH